jgi:hypothetical protein
MSGFSSTFTRAKITLPANLLANLITIGSISLQG